MYLPDNYNFGDECIESLEPRAVLDNATSAGLLKISHENTPTFCTNACLHVYG